MQLVHACDFIYGCLFIFNQTASDSSASTDEHIFRCMFLNNSVHAQFISLNKKKRIVIYFLYQSPPFSSISISQKFFLFPFPHPRPRMQQRTPRIFPSTAPIPFFRLHSFLTWSHTFLILYTIYAYHIYTWAQHSTAVCDVRSVHRARSL